MIKKWRFKRLLILMSISILLGILLGQTGIFGLMKTIFVLFITLIICGLFVLIGEIKSNPTLIKFGGTILTFILFTGASIFVTYKVHIKLKSQRAEEIVHKLKDYKKNNGHYPRNLGEIGSDDQLNYTVDSLKTHYTIQYSIDGWHYKVYSSKTNKWISSD